MNRALKRSRRTFEPSERFVQTDVHTHIVFITGHSSSHSDSSDRLDDGTFARRTHCSPSSSSEIRGASREALHRTIVVRVAKLHCSALERAFRSLSSAALRCAQQKGWPGRRRRRSQLDGANRTMTTKRQSGGGGDDDIEKIKRSSTTTTMSTSVMVAVAVPNARPAGFDTMTGNAPSSFACSTYWHSVERMLSTPEKQSSTQIHTGTRTSSTQTM